MKHSLLSRCTVLSLCICATLGAACDEKKEGSASSSASGSALPKSSGPASTGAASTGATGKPAPAPAPAPTPAPEKTAPASSLPVKGPWEAVKITFTKEENGTPYFTMENLGQKTITVCFIDFYGYDEKGSQLVHKTLSWNGSLEGGKKDDRVDTEKADGVKTWEATYHGIKFEGDDKVTTDDKRAPAKRPKGG